MLIKKYFVKNKMQQDNIYSPNIWGPGLWLNIHTGSLSYPENPSVTTRERMKWFIWGLPMILPCQTCKDHATAYVMRHNTQINEIVTNRKNLFEFFVDFHNAINQRHRKPLMSYREASILYQAPEYFIKQYH
jgi:hypothetical protein